MMLKLTLIFIIFGVGAYAQVVNEDDIHYFLWNTRTSRERLWLHRYGNNIDRNAALKILIHGWTHDINSFWYPIVTDTYVRTGVNVIAIDWGSHAQLPLPIATSVERLDALGLHIARFILDISATLGIPLNRIHIIGHSLGAHLAGFTGDNVRRISGQSIRRITGLDPAGLQFTLAPSRDRLSTDDAEQVDTILSDAGPTGAGIARSIGHVNFWPNGGIAIQPGCDYYPCSHNRACHYFNEGITSNRFVSRRCLTYLNYLSGLCMFNPQNIMGENVNFNVQGDFFLITNGRSPFARG